MKLLKLCVMLLTIPAFFAGTGIAKNYTKTNIPATVLNAFAAKYPKAAIKNWRVAEGEYIARAKEDHHKYFAVFDKQGNWIKTTTKLNWPWHISPVVKEAFKKTKHGGWHIYGVNIIDKPSGQYVELLVDDANQIPNNFQNLQPVNWLLEFKLTGELVKEVNTNAPPLL